MGARAAAASTHGRKQQQQQQGRARGRAATTEQRGLHGEFQGKEIELTCGPICHNAHLNGQSNGADLVVPRGPDRWAIVIIMFNFA